MSEFNYKDYVANNPLLSEVKLNEEEEALMKDSSGNTLVIGDIIKGENNVRYQIRYSPLRDEIVLQPSVEVDGEEFYADGKEITNVGDKEKFVDIVTNSTRIKGYVDVKNSKAFIYEKKKEVNEFDDESMKAYGDAVKKAYGVKENLSEEKKEVNEVQDRTEALDKLRDMLEDLKYMSKEANELMSMYFPGAHNTAEAYGALDFGTSSNKYDTTLESLIDAIERGVED